MRCNLNVYPKSFCPSLEGDYIIFNPCDGYHVVQGVEVDGKIIFQEFGGREVADDFYVAWARLPTTELMYELFAKKGREG